MHALSFLILVVTLASQQLEEQRHPKTSQEDVEAGAKTFRSHCSPCHGMRGEGGLGPNLASGRFYHGSSDSDLLKNISQGIPGTQMPGLFYSPDRVWQVVSYLRSLHSTARSTGNAKRGSALFADKGCPQCHRIQGLGGGLGPDLTQVGEARSLDYLRDSILAPNAYVAERYWVVTCRDEAGLPYQGFLMNQDTYTVQLIDFHQQLHSVSKASLKEFRVEKVSKMPSYRDRLSDKEVDDVVAFLSSLRHEGEPQ